MSTFQVASNTERLAALPILRLSLAAILGTVLTSGFLLRADCTTNTPASGCVHFFMRTEGGYGQYLTNTTPSQELWFQDHFWGLQTYSPSQDQILSWYNNAFVYVESYGVPPGSPLALAHPEWIMKDINGNPLYVNYNCSNGACSQWSFDFSNVNFVQYLLNNQILPDLAKGYEGIWLDNVDMQMNTSDGNGNPVAPVDSATGAPMTQAGWEQYMANFVTQIRQATPNAKILHNMVWFAGTQPAGSDPYVTQEILAADIVNLERGISDPNLVAGSGQFSMSSFLTFIDYVHSLNRPVDIQELAFNGDYGLAGYFLISSGMDLLSNDQITPNNWWSGYDVNLGTPYAVRYAWNGVLRRDFTNGLVFLNPPGSATATFALPSGSFVNTSGAVTTSVTLAAGQAAVLVGAYTPPPVPVPIRIDSGGPAVGNFMADCDLIGGHGNVITSPVNVTGVANAAPQQVYQTKLSANSDGKITYTIPALTPNYVYTVRLHFADDVCTRVGQRLFNVAINGTTVLQNFDIFKEVGKLKADVKTFTASSGNTGQIVIQLTNGSASNALINGLEILP
jgi:Malectin domain